MSEIYPMGIVSFKTNTGEPAKTPKLQNALLWHTETPRQWCRETLFIEPKSVSVDDIKVSLDQKWQDILKEFPSKDLYQIEYTKY